MNGQRNRVMIEAVAHCAVAILTIPSIEGSASATAAGVIAEFNIACMGAFTIGNKLREELTDAFLTNEFVPGCPSQLKVDAFREYEAAHQK
jgi:ribose 5-phosphate isomerase RpiB